MKRDLFSNPVTRRDFCKACVFGGAALALTPSLLNLISSRAFAKPAVGSGEKGFINRHEALFYDKLDENTVQCRLCPRTCTLANGMRGVCRVREPKKGKLYTLVYGNPTAVHVDPIEKKPLFHFLPATTAFSIATAGCNFRCKNCQNWQISQSPPDNVVNYYLPPEEVVKAAKKTGAATIAYTYTEPVTFYEYMFDTAKIARREGIKNIFHSNGSINPEPMEKLAGVLDGANVDLKGFTQEFYSSIPGGRLRPVLETLKLLRAKNVHLEITVLLIPSLNDDMKTIEKMCRWIKSELGGGVPVHFSRFHPTYKLKNLPPTPTETLEKARDIALKAGLKYVYIGNVPRHPAESTYCPNDGKVIIRRIGYHVLENNVVNGKCKFCGTAIPGVWAQEKKAVAPAKTSWNKPSRYLG